MLYLNHNVPNIFQNIHALAQSNKSNSANFSSIDKRKELPQDKRVIIPHTSQILIGNDFLLNSRNENLHRLLDTKQQVTIGRNSSCDIVPSNFYNGVMNTHLSLEKTQNRIVAKDLSQGQAKTQIIPKSEIKPFMLGLENIKFSQGNIGDCFLLAELYALSQNPKGRKYLEKMVSIDENGNWIVKFHNVKPITITPSELNGETYKNGTKKEGVSGDLTIKAIERAYAKLIKKPNDNADFMQLNRGGYPVKSLFDMTGINAATFHINNDCIDILKEIEKNGIDNYILTCSTPHQGTYGRFMNTKGKFISAHAYAIKSIDTKAGIVQIVNPHNTKITETISIKDFQKMFDFIYAARV